MVWGGISLEGRTDLYRLDNGTLTAIRYQDEILGPVVRAYTGAVGPGFLLVHNNARPHVARVCRQFLENEGIDTIDWPTGSPDLNPIEHLWDIMFRSIRRHQVALQTVQELSDALVQIWEEIPQDTIRRLICSEVMLWLVSQKKLGEGCDVRGTKKPAVVFFFYGEVPLTSVLLLNTVRSSRAGEERGQREHCLWGPNEEEYIGGSDLQGYSYYRWASVVLGVLPKFWCTGSPRLGFEPQSPTCGGGSL
ncbi:hypothetical protein NFI96_000384 [Prochilodus magdalenae]|nr:hypothetical protein NFI96_000384 [Prochilodus magdalenae]